MLPETETENTVNTETIMVDGLETELNTETIETDENIQEMLQSINDNQQMTNILLLILIGTIIGFSFVKGMFQLWR